MDKFLTKLRIAKTTDNDGFLVFNYHNPLTYVFGFFGGIFVVGVVIGLHIKGKIKSIFKK